MVEGERLKLGETFFGIHLVYVCCVLMRNIYQVYPQNSLRTLIPDNLKGKGVGGTIPSMQVDLFKRKC